MNRVYNGILKRGLIVSCQADNCEALIGVGIMARMALAAELGGAGGLRVEGITDLQEVRALCKLPIIGIIKKEYPGFEPYITATMQEIDDLMQVKPDIIAIDATFRARPGFDSPRSYIAAIKNKYDIEIMADVSNLEEGIHAWEAGADVVATTLSSYTPYTAEREKPDIELIRALSEKVDVPVIAEGNIVTPELALACLEAGAYAIVVGGAITRPDLISRRFVDTIGGAIRTERRENSYG
ncbi:N-acetylmannosamine-6-phosphate 2-epimerase [Paenibacillus nasutitermitis]|uniref:Putative N-acetylmannosamine-6-phosphate 2-epimerase n=1 Tax=Paenibacillus nasutitermitis TaxID=1652958 RepID=A0A916YRK9_9BACL|nr:N-acetylmannosamine-6-phosphate 2-epimerase [Paenibacillus nasutitermitis]GGD56307.1 putative N-acetylmannosamine-6-phosphate 2-epimerase [Paenibacillus nasutitermitis]